MRGWAGAGFALAVACAPAPPPPCVGFVGDLSLGRGLGERLLRQGPAPGLLEPGVLEPATAWIGNLEGALTPSPDAACLAPEGLCLGFSPADLPALDRLPLAALSLANNHALDHGEDGRVATWAALAARELQPLSEEGGPHFLDHRGQRLGLVAVDLSRRDPSDLPRVERALLQVRRARAEADLVAVLPHWGIEEEAALGPEQEVLAARFHLWGADLVAGSGAHVAQEVACTGQTLTAWGLGNFLFDDPPGSPRGGLALRCCAEDGAGEDGVWGCLARPTLSEGRWPRSDRTRAEVECTIPRRSPPDLRWKAHRAAADFVSVEPFPPAGDGAFLALWMQPSTFDDAMALRPLVFSVQGGRATDLWRGTALGRPLVAARVLADGRLCAIERGDSFLAPDPDTLRRQELAYRWTGFGFAAEGGC